MISARISLVGRNDFQSDCLDRGIFDGLFLFNFHPSQSNGNAAVTV